MQGLNTIVTGTTVKANKTVLTFNTEADAKAACPEGYFVDVLERDSSTLEPVSYCVKKVSRDKNNAAHGFEYLSA